MLIPDYVTERALANATRDPATGCLVSHYSLGSHGYAQIGWQEDGRTVGTLVHRVAWIAEHGEIPDGLTVDHTCKNKPCLEVGHLRLLTNYENARRTFGRDWPLGRCINGHSNDELIVADGGRRIRCGPCRTEYQRTYRAGRAA